MSTRRRLLALLAVVGAAAIVAAVVLLAGGSGSGGSAATTTGASTGAATVQRRNLVLTDTESGTVSYSDPQTVYDRLSGTITWLPAVGQRISAGQALFRVDGEPVLLLNGSVPAYRDLSAADTSGPDVLELNRNLVALGFGADALVADDEWQAGTTAGIDALQASLGEAQTGELALGQIVFLPGPQLIAAQDVTVGSTNTGGSSAPTAAALDDPAPRPEFVGLSTTIATPAAATHRVKTKKRQRHRRLTQRQEIAALLAALRADAAALRAARASAGSSSGQPSGGSGGSSHHTSAHSGSGGSGSGGSGGSGGGSSLSAGVAVLQTSSTHLIVAVDLPASSQSEAKVHERVGVELPDGTTVPGTITAVSAVAAGAGSSGSGAAGGSGAGGSGSGGSGSGGSGGSGSGSSSTIPVTIALHGRHPTAGLDEAAVSVNFVQQKARNVLSVPVTALLAVSGDSYAVREALPPHALLPVTTGLFAAGDVEISGPGIRPGLQVTDSQG